MKNNIIIFKKIKFYNLPFLKLYSKLKKGGYLVAPAASALTNIDNNNLYYNSLIKSDIAIFDSGFFCILLRIFKGIKVSKFSGYLFLKKFLNIKFKKNTKFLCIDPSIKEAKVNKKYLNSKNIINVKNYVAPIYSKNNIFDKKLIKLIKDFKPNYIIINLGGETQEILGLYIKTSIKFKTSILCTGAAIAFLTKSQAPINDTIDKLYMGWLLRTIYNPREYFLRILKSLYLIKYFLK